MANKGDGTDGDDGPFARAGVSCFVATAAGAAVTAVIEGGEALPPLAVVVLLLRVSCVCTREKRETSSLPSLASTAPAEIATATVPAAAAAALRDGCSRAPAATAAPPGSEVTCARASTTEEDVVVSGEDGSAAEPMRIDGERAPATGELSSRFAQASEATATPERAAATVEWRLAVTVATSVTLTRFCQKCCFRWSDRVWENEWDEATDGGEARVRLRELLPVLELS